MVFGTRRWTLYSTVPFSHAFGYTSMPPIYSVYAPHSVPTSASRIDQPSVSTTLPGSRSACRDTREAPTHSKSRTSRFLPVDEFSHLSQRAFTNQWNSLFWPADTCSVLFFTVLPSTVNCAESKSLWSKSFLTCSPRGLIFDTTTCCKPAPYVYRHSSRLLEAANFRTESIQSNLF